MSDNLTPLPSSPNTSKPAARPRGFSCAKCNKALATTKTINSAPGVVTRYRACETAGCPGRHLTTVTEERQRTLDRRHRPKQKTRQRRKAKATSY